MNKASGLAATLHYRAYHFMIKASLFHSTPVLERKRRTHWDSGSYFKSSPKKFNQFYKRQRKQNLLHDVSEFAEHIFQSWKSNGDEYNEPKHSWFRPTFPENGGYRRERMRNKASRSFREFEFCIDEDEHDDKFETIFRSAFGGNPFFHSFSFDDQTRYRNSSSYYYNRSRSNYYYYQEDDSDSSSENEKLTRDLSSDRVALGLSKSGPLNLGDVKNAYRACALKWHPDRHHGSTKAVAEEKFKACSAAYQSLCSELTVN